MADSLQADLWGVARLWRLQEVGLPSAHLSAQGMSGYAAMGQLCHLPGRYWDHLAPSPSKCAASQHTRGFKYCALMHKVVKRTTGSMITVRCAHKRWDHSSSR